MKKRIALLVVLLFVLTACSGPAAPDASDESQEGSTASEPSESAEEASAPDIEPASEPEEPAPSGKKYADLISGSGLVRDDAYGVTLENTGNLVEWVQSYRLGYPAEVSILLDGLGFPSTLVVLQCDGSPTYTITKYWEPMDGDTPAPVSYSSSMVIERAYDYVFGADVPVETEPNATVVHHTLPAQPEKTSWNPNRDAPLHGITPEEAERRAEEQENRMIGVRNIYGGGIFLKESMLAEVAKRDKPPDFHSKTVGAIRLGNHLCYLVYCNADKEALERGEHGGSVTAVSVDGALVWSQSMVDGAWMFADDANQATYPGTWPEVETDFYAKAYAMGYTDRQLARLENASWASANTVLNLTQERGTSFAFGGGDGRYGLGSYLVDAGGEAMTACMYLQDRETGRVTILPDWQNGYSDFAFLDGETFYAAIAQVGGADYEAGVRFYHAANPAQPYARWDLTDSRVESETEKVLLSVYHSEEQGRLAVFWCEVPKAWGGWVEDDSQTYRVTLLDPTGAVIKDLDTGVTLAQGHLGIARPDCQKPADTLPPVAGSIYFQVAKSTYTLNLESGQVKVSAD